MYTCKMVIPKPSKHVDTRTLQMMLVVGSKYNALYTVSGFSNLFGKSAARVYTMPRGSNLYCQRWKGRTPHKPMFQCAQQKPFRVPNTRIELTQKLTKSMPRRRSIRVIYTREKYLCTNLGVKEEGGHLLEGGLFFWVYTRSVCYMNNQHTTSPE